MGFVRVAANQRCGGGESENGTKTKKRNTESQLVAREKEEALESIGRRRRRRRRQSGPPLGPSRESCDSDLDSSFQLGPRPRRPPISFRENPLDPISHWLFLPNAGP